MFNGGDPMNRILGLLNLNAYLPTPEILAPDLNDNFNIDDLPF
jgi:hypothetical protein